MKLKNNNEKKMTHLNFKVQYNGWIRFREHGLQKLGIMSKIAILNLFIYIYFLATP